MSESPNPESEELRAELASILQDTRRHLEWLDDAGISQLPGAQSHASVRPAGPPPSRPAVEGSGVVRPSFLKEAPKPPPPAPPPAVPPSSVPPPSTPAQTAPPPTVAKPPPSMPLPQVPVTAPTTSRDDQLRAVRAEIGDCTRCRLCEGRTSIVFGQGHPNAEIMFVGEGPGEDEDNTGLPFVGRAGQLLTKMIFAMGYTRDEVYVSTVVKCRPPNDRRAAADEVATCRPFVEKQIDIVQPKVIVALGRTASNALLGREIDLARERGRWGEFRGTPVMPTFHPAYLLEAPDMKRHTWNDLKAVLARLGRTPPPAKKA